MKSIDEFKEFYINTLQNKKNTSTYEKTFLLLNRTENKTKLQQNALNRLLNEQYKIYKAEQEIKELKAKANEKINQSISSLNKTKKNDSRKQRAHRLIQQGLLIDVTDFYKDADAIAGALLFVLDKTKNDANLLNELKTLGSDFLKDKKLNRF